MSYDMRSRSGQSGDHGRRNAGSGRGRLVHRSVVRAEGLRHRAHALPDERDTIALWWNIGNHSTQWGFRQMIRFHITAERLTGYVIEIADAQGTSPARQHGAGLRCSLIDVPRKLRRRRVSAQHRHSKARQPSTGVVSDGNSRPRARMMPK